MITEFVSIPVKNKIAFISNEFDVSTIEANDTTIIVVPEIVERNRLGGDETPYTFKYFNVLKYLNKL